MPDFPRTTVGGLSVSRMVIGTNWFRGFSHTTHAKDELILQLCDRKHISDILTVFFRNGIDTLIARYESNPMLDAVRDAEQRTGRKALLISTPAFPIGPETPEKGLDLANTAEILDRQASFGVSIVLPHQCTTDALLDRCTRRIRQIEPVLRMIRDRGMIPGFSTHMPETIMYSDESGLDVETYISIFNAMGFLMQVEVDWTARVIRNAKKPVLTIKPLAAGHLRPFQALTFVWNAIREQDMVAVGTLTPREAEEVIELSRSILERRAADIGLQETRSKRSIKPKA